MFGMKFTTDREIKLQEFRIADLNRQIDLLTKAVEEERRRAELEIERLREELVLDNHRAQECINVLHGDVEHERKRAEAAINALLMRTAKLVLTPDSPATMEEQEKLKERQMDIFGDGASYDEEQALEELQS